MKCGTTTGRAVSKGYIRDGEVSELTTKRKQSLRMVAGVAVLAIAAAACSSDKKSSSSSSVASTTSVAVPKGGTLVVGAEQEPDCADWIASCAGSSWGYWMMNVTTMPRVYDTVNEGGKWVAKPSSLVTGEPSIDLKDPTKPVVTYKINPKAVWSDGTAITCDDFAYTWDAIANGKDIYDPTGYTDIAKVDCTDEASPVVSFKKPVTAWKGLFGGGYGIYPAHLLKGKDHEKIMTNGYTFSGGPWMISKWDKGVSITLVPNTKYWGKQPTIGKVIFKFIPDTSASFQAFKANEVQVMYPQPQPDALLQIKGGLKGATVTATGDTGNVEALWMNNNTAPFNDINFRKAVAYSINRDQVVNRLFGVLGVKKAQNSFNPPIVASYSTPAGFAGYTKNPSKAASFMKKAGYTKSGGYWTKGGQKASFTLKTTVGNKRRALTAQILQAELKQAGIDMKIETVQAGDFFGEQLPKGDYQLGLYAQVATTPDPGLCTIFCSTNIPSAANDNSGQNWTGTNVKGLDTLLEQVDSVAVTAKRQKISKAADLLIGASATSLPLDPLPNILLYKNTVKGKVADNAVEGPFAQMNYWTYKG